MTLVKKDNLSINSSPTKTKLEVIIMVLGVIIIAANLRAPITSVGPVIMEITKELRLTPVLVGLITTIPLMSFALLSTFTPKAARLIGLEKLLLYSLLLLAIGLFTRSIGNIFFLFLGAALIGIAITIGNVLMPAFIKKEFPEKSGLITGYYLVSMNLVSALAVGYSIRIGQITGFGWQASIGIWGLFALLGFFIWLPQLRKKTPLSVQDKSQTAKTIWKSRLAWQIALFMGLQSFFFYIFAAWLPAMLQNWDMSADRSGWMLSYIQMGQVPMMLIGPLLAARMKNQTSLVWVTFILLLIGLAGVLFWKTEYIIVSVILVGISLGLAFALATMFFVLRTKSASESADLSGMSQSIGYLIAACGPPIFGALYSVTSNWYVPLLMLFGAAFILLLVGLAAARDKYVT